eukprot:gb/GFBE01037142.1/.p1 GENE.gb/GFBE01037142.1/~~gb/GFBE01037142.1/.p1  ORF type:complete len:114 (+),score=14.86 gb/GFBE01037142.1/:1-342(+)
MGNGPQRGCRTAAGTTERLVEAVCRMQVNEVEEALACGVPVNAPVDRFGHTILDKFVVEHAALLNDALNVKGQPEDITRQFYEMEEAALQVMKVLVDHGAVLTGQSAALKRGL